MHLRPPFIQPPTFEIAKTSKGYRSSSCAHLKCSSSPFLSLLSLLEEILILESRSLSEPFIRFHYCFPLLLALHFCLTLPTQSSRTEGENYNKPTVKNIVILSHASPVSWKTHPGICIHKILIVYTRLENRYKRTP